MIRVWLLPALLVLSGALTATSLLVRGNPVAAVALAILFAVLALINSPLIFPKSISDAEARAAADGRPVVYWRPGCKYCARLRIRLGAEARRLHWVNIWTDPDAAARVRAANDGNETVPTVFISGHPYTNPDPAWLNSRSQDASRSRSLR